MSSVDSLRRENIIISVLVHIDSESEIPDISEEEFLKCAFRLTKVLNKLEKESGEHFMMSMFIAASKRAGHTIGPLDHRLVQKLVKNGFVVKNLKKVLKYEKTPATEEFMGYQNNNFKLNENN